MSDKWESLLNNLGHVSRKLGHHDDALDYHKQALVLKPLSASTYSAVGYAYALKGDLVEAVEAFHKALGIRRDDTFATTMLNNVIEQLDDPPFPDSEDLTPRFDPIASLSSPPEDASSPPEQMVSTDDIDMSDSNIASD